MAVYVDPLFATPRSKRWPYAFASHLEADSEIELDLFARRLGLPPCYKQPPKSPRFPWPHYDITPAKREIAIRMGAVEQTRREAVMRRQKWRENL